jgi:hypothetical protein
MVKVIESKIKLIFLLTGLLMGSSQAAVLTCHSASSRSNSIIPEDHDFERLMWRHHGEKKQGNHAVLLKDFVQLWCVDRSIKSFKLDAKAKTGIDLRFHYATYLVRIEGLGFGMRYSAGEGVVLACPTIKSKQLGEKNKESEDNKRTEGYTKFKGFKASTSFILGADVGVFRDPKDKNICVLLGAQIGSIGGSVSKASMTIVKRKNYRYLNQAIEREWGY